MRRREAAVGSREREAADLQAEVTAAEAEVRRQQKALSLERAETERLEVTPFLYKDRSSLYAINFNTARISEAGLDFLCWPPKCSWQGGCIFCSATAFCPGTCRDLSAVVHSIADTG